MTMNEPITIHTIGFTKKNARTFFSKLTDSAVERIIDVRLNNVSQLAGFAKRDDLEFFLEAVAGIAYLHLPELAPTKDLLDGYKNKTIDWDTYEKQYITLLDSRNAEQSVSREVLGNACLLCSEAEPTNCHRRLLAEYLQDRWGNVNIQHIT